MNMNSLLMRRICASWLRGCWGGARPKGQRLALQKSFLAWVSSSPVSARVMMGCQSKLSLSVLFSLWVRKLRISPFFTWVVRAVGTFVFCGVQRYSETMPVRLL